MDAALQALIDTIRSAHAQRRPLRIRGGGSKDFLGQSLQGEVLDTRVCTGIVSHEPSELVITARAGTPLAELEAQLARHGQCLPFEPPHFADTATVGGMVAAGLSGPARASVGAVRDYVLGVQLINGRGEWLTFGGQVMKNVAGYDVSRLMAGAMGSLGVLTEVSLKVLPVAPAEATLAFELDAAAALDALHRWGGQPLPLNASCWVQDQGRALLFVRLRGAVAAVDAACRRMGGQRMDTTAEDAARIRRDWLDCAEQRLPFFRPAPQSGLSLWRVSVAQTAPVRPLGGVPPHQQLIEWHGGQRWLWAPATQAATLRAEALALGGHATLFRPATDADRAHGVFTPPAAALQAITQRLKAEFDPAGLFNPGRMATPAA
ncbi:MAG TPA: glycolate oxidase subunit GlcE [Burkholderiaceae bacterium]|nr:glycolate oxidase subunit GlcE [Burkholderiaceae bacterium]